MRVELFFLSLDTKVYHDELSWNYKPQIISMTMINTRR